MAVCRDCAQEMLMEVSCVSHPVALGGRLWERVRWGHERESRTRKVDPPCRDCGTPVGGVHHLGCCLEQCPACTKQAICCGCFETRDRRRRVRCHHHRFPGRYRLA